MNGFDPVQQKRVRSKLVKLKPNEYLVSFTAGGLLAEETRYVLLCLNGDQISMLPSEIKNNKRTHRSKRKQH